MLGLVNRSIEVFLRETYGEKLWQEIASRCGVDGRGFNSLRNYPDEVTTKLLRDAALKLGKSTFEILEDTGSWLVRLEPLRRLLRFSGGEFADFVLALEELPGRARMALSGLDFPPLIVTKKEGEHYLIHGTGWPNGMPWIIAGALRGMADDYGVLALIEAGREGVKMHVLEQKFTPARPFELSPFRPESPLP